VTRQLALDTSGGQHAVVLLEDESLRAGAAWPRTAGNAPTLLGQLDTLIRQAGWELPQLDAVAVARGPGSFTGIRVGLSLGAGIAYGCGVPLYLIESLAILAAQARPGAARVAVLREAGRGEVFAWRAGASAVRLIPGEVAGWLGDADAVIVEPAGSLQRWVPSRGALEVPIAARLPFSQALAGCAVQAFRDQKAVRYHEIEALYVQPAAVEERRRGGQGP